MFTEPCFANNDIFMNLMAAHFPEHEVVASLLPQAKAFGAASIIKQTIEITNGVGQKITFFEYI